MRRVVLVLSGYGPKLTLKKWGYLLIWSLLSHLKFKTSIVTNTKEVKMQFLLHLSFLYHFLLIPTLLMEPNHAIRFELSNRTQSNSQKKLNNSTQSKVRMTWISTIGFDLKMDGFDDGFH